MTKYQAVKEMELAAQAYSPFQPLLQGENLTIIDDPATDVQCYIRKKGGTLSITFRGTNSNKDRITDLTFCKKVIPYGNYESRIRVHGGFLAAYKSPAVRDKLHSMLTPDIHRVRIAGHSYGAALAVLCGVDLQYAFPQNDYEVFLFGCPRVGNAAFQRSYNKRVFKTLRFENGNDAVTKVPFAVLGFRHAGVKIHLGQPRIFGLFCFQQHRQQSYYSKLFKAL